MNYNPWFDLAKEAYDKKNPMYTPENLRAFVFVGWISEEEYEQITGIKY